MVGYSVSVWYQAKNVNWVNLKKDKNSNSRNTVIDAWSRWNIIRAHNLLNIWGEQQSGIDCMVQEDVHGRKGNKGCVSLIYATLPAMIVYVHILAWPFHLTFYRSSFFLFSPLHLSSEENSPASKLLPHRQFDERQNAPASRPRSHAHLKTRQPPHPTNHPLPMPNGLPAPATMAPSYAETSRRKRFLRAALILWAADAALAGLYGRTFNSRHWTID